MRLDWAAALVLLPLATPAAAHGGFGAVNSLASGALHLLTSPMSLAALAGLAVVLAGRERPAPWVFVLLAGAGAAAGAALIAVAPKWLAPASIALLGLCAAAALRVPPAAACVLAVVGGMGAGLGSDLDLPIAVRPVAGAAAALAFPLLLLLVGYEDVRKNARIVPFMGIAGRVVGAWVAAIGLLLGALAGLARGQAG